MISVKNLNFKYQDEVDVIKDLSFFIEKGKWVSILGHNGSGKSTLAKLLVRILEQDSGSITIGSGDNAFELNDDNIEKLRKSIGIVFQNPDNQFVGVDVKHDIAFAMENRNIKYDEMIEKINHSLKIVNMEKYINTPPESLSGGQKQRIAIAGLLAIDHDIFIFDEATSMLDPEGRNDVLEIIKYLNKEHNKTIITITHDTDFALQSDQTIVLRQGEIIYQGSPLELFSKIDILEKSNLEMPYIVKLINDIDNEEIKKSLWQLALKK